MCKFALQMKMDSAEELSTDDILQLAAEGKYLFVRCFSVF